MSDDTEQHVHLDVSGTQITSNTIPVLQKLKDYWWVFMTVAAISTAFGFKMATPADRQAEVARRIEQVAADGLARAVIQDKRIGDLEAGGKEMAEDVKSLVIAACITNNNVAVRAALRCTSRLSQ